MGSLIFTVTAVVVGMPALLVFCACMAGSRLIQATEATAGDCARSLSFDEGRHPRKIAAGSSSNRFGPVATGRPFDPAMDALAN